MRAFGKLTRQNDPSPPAPVTRKVTNCALCHSPKGDYGNYSIRISERQTTRSTN